MKNLILVIAFILVAGGCFYAGMRYERLGSSNSFGASGQRAFNKGDFRPSADMAARFGAGRNGAGGTFINGEVLSRDEESITIKTPDGGSKILYFSQETAIQKTVDGTLEDIQAGTYVRASGNESTEGVVTADNIFIGVPQPGPEQTEQ